MWSKYPNGSATKYDTMNGQFPIDAVIAWVDGDDPRHRAKRTAWMQGGREALFDDIAGETRYRQAGEIIFCVASILRFAPFIRKIHIVTDSQVPALDDFLTENFPDNNIPVEIVDHKVIFDGYEHFLPTFNSLSIETMLWRIPDLAEHYVYLNDDFTIISPVSRQDFFTDEGWPVVYADARPVWWARMLHALKPKRNGHKPFGFKDSLLNAAEAAGTERTFLLMDHTPYPMNARVMKNYFEEHPQQMIVNLRHRFRDAEQYNPQALFYELMRRSGECRTVSPRDKLIYMKPKPRQTGYIARKVRRAEESRTALFMCANSLDAAEPREAEVLRQWLCKRLSITITRQTTQPS